MLKEDVRIRRSSNRASTTLTFLTVANKITM